MRVLFTLRLGQNILGGKKRTSATTTDRASAPGLLNSDIVWIKHVTGTGTATDFYIATFDTAENTWRFGKAKQKGKNMDPTKKDLRLNTDDGKGLDPSTDSVHIVTLTVTVTLSDGSTAVWSGLAPDFAHTLNDQADSIFDFFANQPASVAQARTLPIVILKNNLLANGLDVLTTLFTSDTLTKVSDSDPEIVDWNSVPMDLEGGNDGLLSSFVEYEGVADPGQVTKTGLMAFEDIDDISIIAAPAPRSTTKQVLQHATKTPSSTCSSRTQNACATASLCSIVAITRRSCSIRGMRGRIDSSYAAFYYPWIRILDPSHAPKSSCLPAASLQASTPATISTVPSTRLPPTRWSTSPSALNPAQ